MPLTNCCAEPVEDRPESTPPLRPAAPKPMNVIKNRPPACGRKPSRTSIGCVGSISIRAVSAARVIFNLSKMPSRSTRKRPRAVGLAAPAHARRQPMVTFAHFGRITLGKRLDVERAPVRTTRSARSPFGSEPSNHTVSKSNQKSAARDRLRHMPGGRIPANYPNGVVGNRHAADRSRPWLALSHAQAASLQRE